MPLASLSANDDEGTLDVPAAMFSAPTLLRLERVQTRSPWR
jgi:hypothetical protein